MDSDDSPSIADPEEAAWVAEQRSQVMRYLAGQRVEHAGVSVEPRWFVAPYVAIWAVRSRENPDCVGWWAISGDAPTDYMTCSDERDCGDILTAFAARWREAAERMAAGNQAEGFTIGEPERARELAPLLARRAELLYDFAVAAKSGK